MYELTLSNMEDSNDFLYIMLFKEIRKLKI